jgi:hypothetical protein
VACVDFDGVSSTTNSSSMDAWRPVGNTHSYSIPANCTDFDIVVGVGVDSGNAGVGGLLLPQQPVNCSSVVGVDAKYLHMGGSAGCSVGLDFGSNTRQVVVVWYCRIGFLVLD